MAVIKSTDLFDPQIVADTVQGYVGTGATCLYGTGAAIVQNGLPNAKASVGSQVTVPYFGSVGDFEDLTNDGDALTPAAFSSTSQQATVTHSGKMVRITARAQGNGMDPMQELARQIAEGLKRKIDSTLIEAARRNTTNEWDSYQYDNQSQGAGTITYDAIVNARGVFGDETDDLCAIACHSKVEKDLRLLKDTAGRPLFAEGNPQEGKLPMVLGIPLIVSDKLSIQTTTYRTLLLRKNALIFWMSDISDSDIVFDKDIATNDDLAAIHIYFACHRYTRLMGRTKPGVVHLLTK